MDKTVCNAQQNKSSIRVIGETIGEIVKAIADNTIEPSQKKGICCLVLDFVPFGVGFSNYLYRVADEDGQIGGGWPGYLI